MSIKEPSKLTFRSKKKLFEGEQPKEVKKTSSFKASRKEAFRKAFGNFGIGSDGKEESESSPKDGNGTPKENSESSSHPPSLTPSSSFILKSESPNNVSKTRTAETLTSPIKVRPPLSTESIQIVEPIQFGSEVVTKEKVVGLLTKFSKMEKSLETLEEAYLAEKKTNEDLQKVIEHLKKQGELFCTQLEEKKAQIECLEQEIQNLKTTSQQTIRAVKMDDVSDVKALKAQLHLKNTQIASLEKEIETLKSSPSFSTPFRVVEKTVSEIPSYEQPDTPDTIVYDDSKPSENYFKGRRGTLDGNIKRGFEVKIIQGRGIKSASGNLVDAFAICKVTQRGNPETPESMKGQKSKVVKKSSNPLWNDVFYFPSTNLDNEKLIISVWDWSLLGSSNLLGEIDVPLRGLRISFPKDYWINIPGGNGSINFVVTYSSFENKPEEGFNDKTIKGATLTKLIQKLTPSRKEKEMDYALLTDILLSYRSVCTPFELFQLLIDRYVGPSSDKFTDLTQYHFVLTTIRTNVASFISCWIETTEDFQTLSELRFQFNQFVASQKGTNVFDECISKLEESLRRSIPLERKYTAAELFLQQDITILQKSISSPVLNIKEARKASLQLNDLDPILLADNISVLEHVLLKNICPSEFIKQAWNKPEKEKKAPNILKYITWFNKISRWVSTEILKRETAEARSVVIAKMIEMAMKMKENNNFNGIMEVISSLHSAAISRLKKSWALLPSNLVDSFDYLSQLLSPNENFKQYREVSKNAKPTCVPYLGLWLTDFTFLDDGNPDFLENNLINVEKIRMVSKRIKDFQAELNIPYSFQFDEKIQEAIVNVEAWDENDLFRISKLREQRTSETEELPSRYDSKSFAKISKSLLVGKEIFSIDAKLNHRDWSLLLSCANEKKYFKDSVILAQGTINKCLFRVKTGTVRIEKKVRDKSIFLAILQSKGMFGEMSALGDYGLSSANVIANDQIVEIYEMDFSFITKLLESEPGLCLRFYYNVAKKLAAILLDTHSNIEEGNKSKKNLLAASETVVASNGEQLNADAFVRKHFSLKENEIVIKTYSCSLKKKVSMVGSLYLTSRHLLFYGRSFGVAFQKKIPYHEIESTERKETNLVIISKTKSSLIFTFKEANETKEAHEMIKEFWQRHSKSNSSSPQSSSPAISRRPSGASIEPMTEVFNVLPQSDWDMMLKGARTITIPTDEIIINQGEEYQRIFQIVRGECRIEVEDTTGKRTIVGYLKTGETFGEISFLSGQGATAHVLAHTEVELTIIEGYFINALINVDLSFGGRFFKYVAILLAHRVRTRNIGPPDSATQEDE